MAQVVRIEYEALPVLQAQYNQLKADHEAQPCSYVSETVGAEQVAQVLARSMGIPVNRLHQSDRDRLLSLHQRLTEQVVPRAPQRRPNISLPPSVLPTSYPAHGLCISPSFVRGLDRAPSFRAPCLCTSSGALPRWVTAGGRAGGAFEGCVCCGAAVARGAG